MRSSLIIVLCFVLGVLVSYFGITPEVLLETDYSIYVLYGLMFLVGITIGHDKRILETLRKSGPKILLLPLGTAVGTLGACAVVGLFLPGYSVFDTMAVGAGFGYYSLSSVFITEYKGVELGTVALLSNIIRELSALLLAPLLVTYFGKLAPIAAGGATTADTTLPIITRYSGSEFVLIAIFHGVALDLSVPFLVTFFCHL